MSKYNPLWEYISSNQCTTITFEEVEKVLGFPIDHSFLNYKKELKDYGYEVKKIHLKEKYIDIEKS